MVGVYVKDQDRAVDFYTSKLGFQVVEDAPMGGGARWLVVAPPGGETRLGLFTPPGMEDRIGTFSHLPFTCTAAPSGPTSSTRMAPASSWPPTPKPPRPQRAAGLVPAEEHAAACLPCCL